MPGVDATGSRILEVIVSSVADAIEAERGGADRLEVVRDLDRGGMTPDLDLVRRIRSAVSLPLRVIVRDDEDFSFPGNEGFARLLATAQELQQIGIDGLVIGFLRNQNADIETTLALLQSVPRLGATFHRAFDETASPLDTVSEIKKCGRIDRILTSGGVGSLSERAARLEIYRQRALGEITLLVGGGLDETSVRFLRAQTGIREFHTGRAVRSPQHASGVVQARLVERMRLILSEDKNFELPPHSPAGGTSKEEIL